MRDERFHSVELETTSTIGIRHGARPHVSMVGIQRPPMAVPPPPSGPLSPPGDAYFSGTGKTIQVTTFDALIGGFSLANRDVGGRF